MGGNGSESDSFFEEEGRMIDVEESNITFPIFSMNVIKNTAIQNLKEGGSPTIFICGSTNSGKSTFGRKLANIFLNNEVQNVGWMECDTGQPEFTPAGLVSINYIFNPITGNPIDHLHQPILSHFVGFTSGREESEYYIHCVLSLFNYFKFDTKNKNYPLIINTNGWIKGLGEKIQERLIREIQPTIIVEFVTEKQRENNETLFDYETLSSESVVFSLDKFIGERGVNLGFSKYTTTETQETVSGKDMRKLTILKYFKLQNQRVPMVNMRPYRVPWKYIRIRFLSGEIKTSLFLFSLNASIVGLCYDPTNYKKVCDSSEFLQKNQNYPELLTSTPICECFGLGLIRAIDPINHLFYILTPIPLELLSRVNTFVKGDIELPSHALLDGAVVNPPYLCSNSLTNNDGYGAAPFSKARSDVPRARLAHLM